MLINQEGSSEQVGTSINVSVLIPAYNMQRFVTRAVRSVLRTTVPDIEVIVLDDGSTDGTLDAVRSFTQTGHPDYDSRVHVYSHTNRGKPATVNRGFDLARGSYVAIVDADDELPKRGLRARYEAACEHGEADLVIGACEVFRGDQTLHLWQTPASSDPETLRRGFYLYPRQPFHLNACLLHQSLIDAAGPINTKRERCEDIDYAMRLLEHATHIARTQQVTYRYQKYRSSFSERVRLRWTTLVHRVCVMIENLQGAERMVGVLAGLSYDTLKMLYELVVGAYPKRFSHR